MSEFLRGHSAHLSGCSGTKRIHWPAGPPERIDPDTGRIAFGPGLSENSMGRTIRASGIPSMAAAWAKNRDGECSGIGQTDILGAAITVPNNKSGPLPGGMRASQ